MATTKKKSSPKAERKPKPKAKAKVKKPKAIEKAEEKPVVVAPEPVPDNPPKADDVPVLVPIQSDTEAFVPAIALVDGQRRIGPKRYRFEKDKEVAGGVLLAHLPMLEEAGQVKRK